MSPRILPRAIEKHLRGISPKLSTLVERKKRVNWLTIDSTSRQAKQRRLCKPYIISALTLFVLPNYRSYSECARPAGEGQLWSRRRPNTLPGC